MIKIQREIVHCKTCRGIGAYHDIPSCSTMVCGRCNGTGKEPPAGKFDVWLIIGDDERDHEVRATKLHEGTEREAVIAWVLRHVRENKGIVGRVEVNDSNGNTYLRQTIVRKEPV